MALKIPSDLKLAQLKTIAVKCGISSSGTKPQLIHRLIDEGSPVIKHGSTRVLSIDMGIRNLAYCALDVPLKSATKPVIRSWQRLAVDTEAHLKPSLPIPNASDIEQKDSLVATKESFSPASLSAAAYTLLRKRLLPLKPTHILIERQRFRSMGSPHILEWTVRVNMFESMIYGVLGTLKGEGLWNGEVIPIQPRKVGPFWLGEDEKEMKQVVVKEEGIEKVKLKKVRNTASAKAKNKGMKIDLVRNWLENDEMVSLGGDDVQRVATAYMEKWDRVSGRKKGVKNGLPKVEGEEELGKLDDLADSLLQGMAWIQWEENKRLAQKRGVEALLDD